VGVKRFFVKPGCGLRLCTYCLLCVRNPGLTLIGVQFAFLLIYLLTLVLSGRETLENIEFVLLNLRVLWIVGASQTYGLPSAVDDVMSVLRMFAGDMRFTHPECSGLSNQSDIFTLNVFGTVSSSVRALVLPV